MTLRNAISNSQDSTMRNANGFCDSFLPDKKDQPLTQKILSDPTNDVTKLILFLYSMESFIYTDLNKSNCDKGHRQIKFLGVPRSSLDNETHLQNVISSPNFLDWASQITIDQMSQILSAKRNTIFAQSWHNDLYIFKSSLAKCKNNFITLLKSGKCGKGAKINQ